MQNTPIAAPRSVAMDDIWAKVLVAAPRTPAQFGYIYFGPYRGCKGAGRILAEKLFARQITPLPKEMHKASRIVKTLPQYHTIAEAAYTLITQAHFRGYHLTSLQLRRGLAPLGWTKPAIYSVIRTGQRHSQFDFADDAGITVLKPSTWTLLQIQDWLQSHNLTIAKDFPHCLPEASSGGSQEAA